MGKLTGRFRRLSLAERRAALAEHLGTGPGMWAGLDDAPELRELADVLVEHAVGCASIPLGVATGLVADGEEVLVPLATEEPSVIAAASYGALLVSEAGGFATWAADPVMKAHLYLEGVAEGGLERLAGAGEEVRRALDDLLTGMSARGGGYRGWRVTRLGPAVVRAELALDVRDALGANLLNSAAELARPLAERLGGGRCLMAILTNAATERRAGARFRLPVAHLAPACPVGVSPEELARRIAAASTVAQLDPERAVTHNKGIMNGITALALATGNDTRAVEAAAHAWAAREGRIVGLSRFELAEGPEGPSLAGEIELPLALGTVGGSVGFTPASALALRLLRSPSGTRLARIGAALGLAQNLAALAALTGDGIQTGHLRLHARRLAWRAGARGGEIAALADLLAAEIAKRGGVDTERAEELLEAVKGNAR